MLPRSPSALYPLAPHSAFISSSAKTSHGISLVSAFPQDLGTRSLRGECCYVPQHSCDLADKLLPSSRSRHHFHLHSEIPETQVSRLNLDAIHGHYPPLHHCHVMPLLDPPDHGISSPPTLSLIYSISLASCSCPTLLSCVSHSCNIAFLCFSLALLIPLT